MGQLDNSSTSISHSRSPVHSNVESVIGEIFYSKNSNLLDTIRFFQVTRMITDSQVIVRELHQMNCYGDNLNYSSPIVSRFISEEIEVEICNERILKGDDVIGKHLKYTHLHICKDVSIKIWDHITHPPI